MIFTASYVANVSIAAGQRLQFIGFDKTGNAPGSVTTIYNTFTAGAEVPANTSVTLSLLSPTLTVFPPS